MWWGRTGSGGGSLGGQEKAGSLEVVGEVLGCDEVVLGDVLLIAAAQEDHPGPAFLVGDLAELDLPSQGIEADFDIILSAGNVMSFLAPSTRVDTLRRLKDHLTSGGRLVTGFGAGRGYDFTDFLSDAQVAELTPVLAFSTWDLRPWQPDSDFLVAVLTTA